MLAQIALITFALLALLSLVVDAGLIRVTQGQMQVAADAGALEGLRFRDVGVINPATGQGVIDPFAADCLRRAAAHRLVRGVFDDDLDGTSENPDYAFGAGPIIDLTEGATSLHAYQTMSVPDPRVYDPLLQLNQQNAVYGDMVSGRFCYNADPAASEGMVHDVPGAIVCTEPQRGAGRYARNDFNPSTNPPQPPAELPQCPAPGDAPPNPWPLPGSGSLTTVDDSAFLVRLRRSNELGDLFGQTEPDVASSGPSLPLLFGRGAPIHGDGPDAAYSVRRDGFTVRATAIAEVRPAFRVGLPQANPFERGLTPFALADTYVQTLSAQASQATINPVNGLICSGLACAGANPPTGVGRFVDSLIDQSRASWLAIGTVGQALPVASPVACALAAPVGGFAGYGPVYSLMASGTNRVIGFVRISLSRDPARPANPCAVVLTRGVPLVATSNATALPSTGLPLPAGTPVGDIRELLDKHLEQNGRLAYGPVLVPALVR